MPAGPSRRIQTSKQAKAAFKARGQSYVSDTERRRIARGAELLQRADRLKAQEERRKEWLKRKEDEQDKSKREESNLGSQILLDRFGHASSQFHLGKFFAVKTRSHEEHVEVQPEEPNASPPLVDENVSDVVPALDDRHEQTDLPTSPIDESFFLDEDFQGSIALKKAPSSPVQPRQFKKHSSLSFPSFGSEDGFFDDKVLAELDRAAMEAVPPPPEKSAHSVILDKPSHNAMPPPALPAKRPGQSGKPAPIGNLQAHGISAADLEWVASCEVQLSQFG
ncbi:hypothetical protein ANO11243_014520 [Dothideomycetidae sp. 11243]|nr:hypothetical protein ANO11243_014520 [fungal sp. No.11243]